MVHKLLLRLPEGMIERVDQQRGSASRNAWITQTLEEALTGVQAPSTVVPASTVEEQPLTLERKPADLLSEAELQELAG